MSTKLHGEPGRPYALFTDQSHPRPPQQIPHTPLTSNYPLQPYQVVTAWCGTTSALRVFSITGVPRSSTHTLCYHRNFTVSGSPWCADASTELQQTPLGNSAHALSLLSLLSSLPSKDTLEAACIAQTFQPK